MPCDPESIRAVLRERYQERYSVAGMLGSGGYACVVAGRDEPLGRDVAIKGLLDAFARDSQVRARFEIEAQALAGLSHPHVVPVYDYVKTDAQCLLVMELLGGGSLGDRFAAGGLCMQTAAAAVIATCDALHYAHNRNILHRDVKPENLLFSEDEVLKLADFGIAKIIGGDEALATRTGDLVGGTPHYISPEQAEGSAIGPAADVYSAGIMLYLLLCGHFPFPDGDPLSVVVSHLVRDPAPLEQEAKVPSELAAVTMRALARLPKNRFASAEDFGQAVAQAARTAWGCGWVDRADVQLQLTSSLLSASVYAVEASNAAPNTVGPDPTLVTLQPDLRMKRQRTGSARPLDPERLERLDKVIELPSPVRPAIVAIVVFLVLGVVAVLSVGGAIHNQPMPVGTVTIGGVDVGSGAVPDIDFSKAVEVRLAQLPPGAGTATDVQLGFSVAGVPLFRSPAAHLDSVGTSLTGIVDARANRYVAAGRVTSELRLRAGEATVFRHRFGVEPVHRPVPTVPGVLAIALAVIVVAVSVSVIRSILRRRTLGSARPTLAVLIGAWGLLVIDVGWLLGGGEPSPIVFAACLIAVGGGNAATAVTRYRSWGRSRGPNGSARNQSTVEHRPGISSG